MSRRAWKVYLNKDGYPKGGFIMVRQCGKSVSFRECLEILDFRGHTFSDIESLDEVWEVD